MRAIIFLPTFCLAAPAAAAVCAPLDEVLAVLADRWQETPRIVGGGGAVTWMITGKTDGTSFSVVQIRDDGTACLVGDGLAWELVPQAPEGEDG